MQHLECLMTKLEKIVKRLALHRYHPPATTASALYVTARTNHIRFIHFAVVRRILLYAVAALKEALKNIPTAKVASYVTVWVFESIAVFIVGSYCHGRGIAWAGRSSLRLWRRLTRYRRVVWRIFFNQDIFE